ncbi:hypothetical protein ACFVYR_36705 [Streptomyces sp. NPDC058284]|uniref:hypothetical protein n=1 Tax=unclassified Streptomyces TaxID=2593676 RepID=UPI0036641D2D
MPIPAQHLQDLVADYLRRHRDEQPLLQPLVDRLAAGANVTDRRAFDGHVTTSGVVINVADDVCSSTTSPQDAASSPAVTRRTRTARFGRPPCVRSLKRPASQGWRRSAMARPCASTFT